jgi:hypothetical protein
MCVSTQKVRPANPSTSFGINPCLFCACAGACLIVGPGQVLSGGAEMQQLGTTPVNVGVNSKGIHIMVPQQHK